MRVYAPKLLVMGLNMLNNTCLVFRKGLGVIGGHWRPKVDFKPKKTQLLSKMQNFVFGLEAEKYLSKGAINLINGQVSPRTFD